MEAVMEELEYIGCPLCDSKDYEKLFAGKDYLFSQKEFTVVRCESCGLLFTNPRVKEDQISHYYFPDYSPYKEVKQSTIFQKAKNRLGRLFGNIHWEILQILQSIKAKTVLEIGPGNGSLLYFLKDRGFEVVGVETDSNCAERIGEKGIPCFLGDLNDVVKRIEPKKFDAVILCQVFEHLYHPKETLRNIFNLINEKGIIYLTLPNSGSLEAKIFGKYWRGFDLPRHIVHYDSRTIRLILTETGFNIIKCKNQIFPSSFLESIAFRFFRKGKMPDKLYYSLYYPWKLLSPIHTKIIGTGVTTVLAKKE